MQPDPARPQTPPGTRWAAVDLGAQTQPQPAVAGPPATPEQRRRAARALDRVVQLRIGLGLAAMAVLFTVAALLAHHSRRFDDFGVVVNGTDPVPVPVPHYSPPWIAAATVAALVGAVLGTLAVVELIRLLATGRRFDRDHTAGLEH